MQTSVVYALAYMVCDCYNSMFQVRIVNSLYSLLTKNCVACLFVQICLKKKKGENIEIMLKLISLCSFCGNIIHDFHISSMRPWDLTNDKLQFESDFVITTWTKHRTPVVRTLSITSLEQNKAETTTTTGAVVRHASRQIQRPSVKRLKVVGEESGSSTAEVDQKHDSDSSEPALSKSFISFDSVNTGKCVFLTQVKVLSVQSM